MMKQMEVDELPGNLGLDRVLLLVALFMLL
jgi:hypothetical protein